MAFTDSQKATIRKYLGWSPRYAQVPEQLEHELAMNSISAFPEQQALVEAQLTLLDTHFALLTGIRTRQAASAVGEITLRGTGELRDWRKIGRQLCAQLASLLGATVGVDFWGESGPDTNSSWGGGSSRNAVRFG